MVVNSVETPTTVLRGLATLSLRPKHIGVETVLRAGKDGTNYLQTKVGRDITKGNGVLRNCFLKKLPYHKTLRMFKLDISVPECRQCVYCVVHLYMSDE